MGEFQQGKKSAIQFLKKSSSNHSATCSVRGWIWPGGRKIAADQLLNKAKQRR